MELSVSRLRFLPAIETEGADLRERDEESEPEEAEGPEVGREGWMDEVFDFWDDAWGVLPCLDAAAAWAGGLKSVLIGSKAPLDPRLGA